MNISGAKIETTCDTSRTLQSQYVKHLIILEIGEMIAIHLDRTLNIGTDIFQKHIEQTEKKFELESSTYDNLNIDCAKIESTCDTNLIPDHNK